MLEVREPMVPICEAMAQIASCSTRPRTSRSESLMRWCHRCLPRHSTRSLNLISTPFGMNSFFDYWFKGQGDDPSITSFSYPSESNPLLDKAHLEHQKLTMTSLAYSIEYGAAFREDQAAVFPWSLIQSCIQDPELFDTVPPGRRFVAGYDPAKWHDRSALVVLDSTARPWQVVDIQDISGRDYIVQAPIVKATVTGSIALRS